MAVDPQSVALLRQMFGLDPLGGGGGNPLTGSSLDDPLQTFMAPALDPRSLMTSQADASGAPTPPTYPEFAAAQDRLRAMRGNTPSTADRVDPSAAAYNAQTAAQNDLVAGLSPGQLDMSTGGMDMSGAPARDRMDVLRGGRAAQAFADANQDPGFLDRLRSFADPLIGQGSLAGSAFNAVAPAAGPVGNAAANVFSAPGRMTLGEMINSLGGNNQVAPTPMGTGTIGPGPDPGQADAVMADPSRLAALAAARTNPATLAGSPVATAPIGVGASAPQAGAQAGAPPSSLSQIADTFRKLLGSGLSPDALAGGAPGPSAPGAPAGNLAVGGALPLARPQAGGPGGGPGTLTGVGGALLPQTQGGLQQLVAAARGAPQLPPQLAAAAKALTAGSPAAAAQAYNAPGAAGPQGPQGPQGGAFTQRMNAPLNAPQPVSAQPATIITPTAVAAAGAAGGAVRAPPPAVPAGAAGSYPAQTAPAKLPTTPAAAVAATTPTPPKPDPQGPMAGSAPASAVTAVENHGFKLPSGTWDALIAFGASAMAHADKPGLMPFGEALQDASKAMTAQDAAKFDHGIKLMTLQAQISEANAKLAEAASNHQMTSDDRKMHYAAMQQNAQLMASVHLQLGQAGLDIKQGQLALQQNQQVINQQSADAKTAEASAAQARQYDEAYKQGYAQLKDSIPGGVMGLPEEAIRTRVNLGLASTFPNHPAVIQAQADRSAFDARSKSWATGPQARDLTAINKMRAEYNLPALTPAAPGTSSLAPR
jgi:hypothetical protein